MPNYEELYYIARNNYNQAVNDLNYIRRTTNDLQTRKNNLVHELGEKRSALSGLKQKVSLLEKAEKKCNSIINDEFPDMKKYVQSTSDEYKKIIESDKGVADIQSIYSSDIQSTQNDLNNILTDLSSKRKNLEDQVDNKQQEVTNCSDQLWTVSYQLNNVGSEFYAQMRVNNYYAQMQEFYRKWINGE